MLNKIRRFTNVRIYFDKGVLPAVMCSALFKIPADFAEKYYQQCNKKNTPFICAENPDKS